MRSGIINGEGGPRSVAALPGILARYHFTTARELEQAALIYPDKVALIDDDGVLTYAQLRAQARHLARYLIGRHGAGPENLRIGVMARNGRGIIVPLGAKGFAGADIFLLNISSSPEQLAGTQEENDINVLIVDNEFLDRMPATAANLEVIVRSEPIFPHVLATILANMPWRANQRIHLTASIFHTWGWACLNIALGARNAIITRRRFDAMECLSDIQRYRPAGLISSPCSSSA